MHGGRAADAAHRLALHLAPAAEVRQRRRNGGATAAGSSRFQQGARGAHHVAGQDASAVAGALHGGYVDAELAREPAGVGRGRDRPLRKVEFVGLGVRGRGVRGRGVRGRGRRDGRPGRSRNRGLRRRGDGRRYGSRRLGSRRAGRRLRSGFPGGSGRRPGRLGSRLDGRDHLPHLDGVAGMYRQRCDHAGLGGRHLDDGLVGLQLDQRSIGLHAVADGGQDAGHRAGVDPFAQHGQLDLYSHLTDSRQADNGSFLSGSTSSRRMPRCSARPSIAPSTDSRCSAASAM